MYSVLTNSGTKGRLNVANARSRFRPATLAAAAIRGAITLAVLSALLLMVARPAQAQTESVLYNFTGTPDGLNPLSRLTLNSGNLYGTTYNGGLYGFGSVFKLSPNGTGGWTETLLYSFCPASPSCTDGQNPMLSYLIFDSQGNLYGTANAGGANGAGVVFELSPAGTTWTETVLHSFAGPPDGANPVNGLTRDAAGNLYGIAYAGGVGNNGAVFELSPSGGSWTEKVIYSINSTYAGLTMNAAGDIFGTSYGTVFELLPNGTGGWNPTVIYTFIPANAAQQGSNPNGTVVLDSAGNIFGTTLTGGANNAGTVFKLTRGTLGKWTEKLLYSFGKNAANPFAGIVFDSAGNIYGTAQAGGQHTAGAVYELVAPTATAGYKEKLLWSFNGENGAVPYDSLILDSAGYLYGTTYGGGSSGSGAVFEVNPHAATTTITVTSSLNPSTQGQAVTFTATVTSSTGATPDGVVVFEPVGQSNLVGGVATYTTSSLKAGSTTITGVYNGNLNFIGSRSVSFQQVVNP